MERLSEIAAMLRRGEFIRAWEMLDAMEFDVAVQATVDQMRERCDFIALADLLDRNPNA